MVYLRSSKRENNSSWNINIGASIAALWTGLNMKSNVYPTDYIYVSGAGDRGYAEIKYETEHSNANKNEWAFSFLPAIYLNINRDRHISMQIELQYQTLKHTNIVIDKISVPIFITYDFLPYNKVNPYVSAGMVFNNYVRASFKDLYINYNEKIRDTNRNSPYSWSDQETYSTNYSEDLEQENMTFNRNGLGGLVNCGAKYRITNRAVAKLEIRYSYSLKKIHTNISNAPGVNSKMNFHSIGSILTFQFAL